MRRRAWAIGIPVCAVLVMSGCAGVQGAAPARETAEPVDAVVCSPGWGGDAEGAPAAGLVPDGFDPIAVIRCDSDATEEDEAGIWAGTAIVRLDGDVSAFVAAMSSPSDPVSIGPCTADAVFVPDVWLASADHRYVRLSYPSTGCGKPKIDVDAELAGLREVGREFARIALVESRGAMDAGCATRAGVLRLAGTDDLVAPPSGGDASAPAPVDSGGVVELIPSESPPLPRPDDVDGIRICAYESAPPARDAVPSPVGDGGLFVGAVTRDADTARTALALAASAQPASPGCRLIATRFVTATFLPEDAASATVTVELDGCGSLVTADLRFLAAPAELIALLTP
jgi:hypothetical protein